jgi:YVTN family beta-propeller protein
MTLLLALPAAGQGSFVNWESPHGHPLDLTPDGTRLLAVNTADNRLEVLTVNGPTLEPAGSVVVGLDPVSVRARTDDEAWVVNHVSDTVSVVDLTTLSVVATLETGDEPADVVFAGAPQRAFVSVSQLNQVRVFDPADLAAPPIEIEIAGEDPRVLATDGQTVYAAIFESGNGTTIIPAGGGDDLGGVFGGTATVSDPEVNPYPGAPNPPPNSGAGFDPPLAPGLPVPPTVGLIVRKDPSTGAWLDDNGGDWSAAVTWDLHDHDVAAIDADTLAVSYLTGLMNHLTGIAVRGDGQVVAVGTEAINEVRFEPNLNGVFVRVVGAGFSPGAATATAVDLNPHLDYTTPTAPQETRDLSIGDPRGVAWSTAGDVGYVAGMGSNNVIVVDAALGRLGLVEVGEGPTGLSLNEDQGVLYVLDRFEGAVSIVDTAASVELQRVPLFDPTPEVIRAGRPHLYDTHRTSGLGHVSCASCHVDGRMDQLAWDLGDPSGEVQPFDQNCNGGIPGLNGLCEDFHPMKGPMTTQTLVGIIGTEPLHWRADRNDLGQFNGAFTGLLGDDEQLTGPEMDEFEAFVATLVPPPNPFRRIFGSLQSGLPNGGSAVTGQGLFTNGFLDGVQCSTCHTLPTGGLGVVISANLLQESQSFKVPQMRNLYEKTGFDRASMSNNRGFGFVHDGSVDTIFSFLTFEGFNFAPGATGDQQRLDVEAFLLSLSTDTHAGIGRQATFGGPLATNDTTLRTQMIAVAGSSGEVGLVAKGVVAGEHRGYYFDSGSFVSDRAAETVTTAELDAAVEAGGVVTYTLVPEVAQVRIGVDRDEDGHFDRDELDACADPADAESVPMPDGCMPVPGDVTGDGVVDVDDLVQVILDWGLCDPPPAGCPSDVDGNGSVDVDDLVTVILNWS